MCKRTPEHEIRKMRAAAQGVLTSLLPLFFEPITKHEILLGKRTAPDRHWCNRVDYFELLTPEEKCDKANALFSALNSVDKL